MINFNELEKAVTVGKVVTVVILVDGKELVAMSFKTDTVAFKEILEKVIAPAPVIADKPKEVKKTEPAKAKSKTVVSRPESEPMDDDEQEEEFPDEDVDSDGVPAEKDNFMVKSEDKANAKIDKPKKEPVDWSKEVPRTTTPAPSSSPMTREQIMAQEEFEQSKQPEVIAGQPANKPTIEEEW